MSIFATYGVTTGIGLALGAAEANPLGVFALIAKPIMLSYADTLPVDERAYLLAQAGAIWGGAAANNICVIAAILTGGALAPVCLIVGVAWGMHEWGQSAMARELAWICRAEREYWDNPDMTCGFLPQ